MTAWEILTYDPITPRIWSAGQWWGKVLTGKIQPTAEDLYLGPRWGGTPHLEDDSAAHAMYLDRIEGWSTSPSFAHWSRSDRQAAENFAKFAFPASGGEAGLYWSMVAEWWGETAPNELTSIDPDQFDKIILATAASANASGTYRENRKLGKNLPKSPGDLLPWWAWIAGAGVVYLLLKPTTIRLK